MNDLSPNRFDFVQPPGPHATWRDWLNWALAVAKDALNPWVSKDPDDPDHGDDGGDDPGASYAAELAELTTLFLKALGAKPPGGSGHWVYWYGVINFQMPTLSSAGEHNLPICWDDSKFAAFNNQLSALQSNPNAHEDYWKPFNLSMMGNGYRVYGMEPPYSLPYFTTWNPSSEDPWRPVRVVQHFSGLYDGGPHTHALSLRGLVGFEFSFLPNSTRAYQLKVWVQMLTESASYSGVLEDNTVFCGVDVGITILRASPSPDWTSSSNGTYRSCPYSFAGHSNQAIIGDNTSTMEMRFKWGPNDPSGTDTDQLKENFISRKFEPYYLFEGDIPWNHDGSELVDFSFQLSATLQIYRALSYFG